MVGEEHSDKSMLWVHCICGLSELRARRKPTTCEDYLKRFCGLSEAFLRIFRTACVDILNRSFGLANAELKVQLVAEGSLSF